MIRLFYFDLFKWHGGVVSITGKQIFSTKLSWLIEFKIGDWKYLDNRANMRNERQLCTGILLCSAVSNVIECSQIKVKQKNNKWQ